MPKNKREAAERANALGALPKTSSAIFGTVPEEKKKDQYYRVDPDNSAQWDVVRSTDDPGEDYVRGTPSTKSPQVDDIAAIKKLKHLEMLRRTNPALARDFAEIINVGDSGKPVAVGTGVSFFNKVLDDMGDEIIPEGENSFTMLKKFLSQDEVTVNILNDKDERVPTKIPGWSSITGQALTKAQVEEATGSKEKVSYKRPGETREEFEVRVRERYPNATEAAVRAAVEKEYG